MQKSMSLEYQPASECRPQTPHHEPGTAGGAGLPGDARVTRRLTRPMSPAPFFLFLDQFRGGGWTMAGPRRHLSDTKVYEP